MCKYNVCEIFTLIWKTDWHFRDGDFCKNIYGKIIK